MIPDQVFEVAEDLYIDIYWSEVEEPFVQVAIGRRSDKITMAEIPGLVEGLLMAKLILRELENNDS